MYFALLKCTESIDDVKNNEGQLSWIVCLTNKGTIINLSDNFQLGKSLSWDLDNPCYGIAHLVQNVTLLDELYYYYCFHSDVVCDVTFDTTGAPTLPLTVSFAPSVDVTGLQSQAPQMNAQPQRKLKYTSSQLRTNRNLRAEMKKQIDRMHLLIRAARHVSDSTATSECVRTNSIDVNATIVPSSRGDSMSRRKKIVIEDSDSVNKHSEIHGHSNETPRKQLSFEIPRYKKQGRAKLLKEETPRSSQKVDNKTSGYVNCSDLWNFLRDHGWRYCTGPESYGPVYVSLDGSVKKGSKFGNVFFDSVTLWQKADELGFREKVACFGNSACDRIRDLRVGSGKTPLGRFTRYEDPGPYSDERQNMTGPHGPRPDKCLINEYGMSLLFWIALDYHHGWTPGWNNILAHHPDPCLDGDPILNTLFSYDSYCGYPYDTPVRV